MKNLKMEEKSSFESIYQKLCNDSIHNKLWYSFNIKVQLKHTIYIDNDSIFHLLNTILETFACWLAGKNTDLSKYGLYQQAF